MGATPSEEPPSEATESPDPAARGDQDGAPDRQAWLSAWGTFLAGVAAFLTLITAAASTYVAVATYHDQQRKDAQERRDAQEAFAKSVDLWETSGRVYLENRNIAVARRVQIAVVAYTRLGGHGYLHTKREIFKIADVSTIHIVDEIGDLPPCSRYTLDFHNMWVEDSSAESKRLKFRAYLSYGGLWPAAQYLDPDGLPREAGSVAPAMFNLEEGDVPLVADSGDGAMSKAEHCQ